MDIALEEADTSINEYHVMEAINMGQDRIQITLSDSQIKVMQCLAKLDSSSPSSKQLQQDVNVKREALRLLLEDLLKQGYVKKEKKGRTSIYSITSTYKPYHYWSIIEFLF